MPSILLKCFQGHRQSNVNEIVLFFALKFSRSEIHAADRKPRQDHMEYVVGWFGLAVHSWLMRNSWSRIRSIEYVSLQI